MDFLKSLSLLWLGLLLIRYWKENVEFGDNRKGREKDKEGRMKKGIQNGYGSQKTPKSKNPRVMHLSCVFMRRMNLVQASSLIG